MLDTLLDDVLGGLLGILDCAAGQPSVEEVEDVIADYEEVLTELGHEVGGELTGRPELRLSLGEGEVRLESIACSDPKTVGLDGRTAAVSAELDPIDLLDLSPLAKASLALDAEAAAASGLKALVPGSYPSETVSFAGDEALELAGILSGVGLDVELLGVDGDHVIVPVLEAVTPILEGLDLAIEPVLELLGVDLARLEGRVLDAECTGRRLLAAGATEAAD